MTQPKPPSACIVISLRPARHAEQDVRALRMRGVKAMAAPMLDICPADSLDIPHLQHQLLTASHLIMTSQQAAYILSKTDIPSSAYIGKPCFCVGQKTAEAARLAGFTVHPESAGTASELAQIIIRNRGDDHHHLLWLSGAHIQTDITEILSEQGLSASRQILYQARAVQSLSPEMLALISSGQPCAVIALSRRTLITFLDLLKAHGLWHHHHQMVLIAASPEMIADIDMNFAACHLAPPADDQILADRIAQVIV